MRYDLVAYCLSVCLSAGQPSAMVDRRRAAEAGGRVRTYSPGGALCRSRRQSPSPTLLCSDARQSVFTSRYTPTHSYGWRHGAIRPRHRRTTSIWLVCQPLAPFSLIQQNVKHGIYVLWLNSSVLYILRWTGSTVSKLWRNNNCASFACCRGRMCLPSARSWQMHSPPWEVARRRCGLLPNYFGHFRMLYSRSCYV